MADKTPFIHVVAVVHAEDGTGEILYVNPSNVRSHSEGQDAAGLAYADIKLLLCAGDGSILAENVPIVRYSACDDPDHKVSRGLIQVDLPVPDGLASLRLTKGDAVLDVFDTAPPVSSHDVAAGLVLGAPNPSDGGRRDFAAAGTEVRAGTSYVVQAKPDTGGAWQTLSVGRPTPEFVIDKNQFPGASNVAIRVIQNAGFQREIIDERTVSLDEE